MVTEKCSDETKKMPFWLSLFLGFIRTFFSVYFGMKRKETKWNVT